MPDQKSNPQAYLTPIAIIVAGIVIAGAVLFKDQISIKFGSTPTVAGTETQAAPTPTKTDLTGLAPAATDAIIGNKDAKVTVTVFSDFACPYCAAAAGQNQSVMDSLKQNFPGWEPVLPNLIKDYVNTNKVRLVFKEFPLHGPAASKAAEAAMCANEQGKYIELADKMFSSAADWETDTDPSTKLIGYASSLGIDISNCLKTSKYAAAVAADYAAGQKLLFVTPDSTTPHGIQGTPTFFVSNTPLVGAQPYSEFKKIIDPLL